MVSQRKRRLFLGLGLVVALALAVSPATASAVSTLSGEHLAGNNTLFIGTSCASSGPYSYTASGTATGPSYPGTFTESGSGTVSGTVSTGFHATLSASFTIESVPPGSFLITGTKSGGPALSQGCRQASDHFSVSIGSLSYQATIHTSTGNYADQGASVASINRNASDFIFGENFTSSLTAPVLITPTNKDQCKNNGWKNFPQFKNQGQCVSFVESHRQT